MKEIHIMTNGGTNNTKIVAMMENIIIETMLTEQNASLMYHVYSILWCCPETEGHTESRKCHLITWACFVSFNAINQKAIMCS